jgi:tRNA pseudouridine38-40 synthase
MAPVTRRFKLVVAYLGTGFSGWQRQRGRRTVQGVLETALARFLRTRSAPSVVAAGRTDAGVHAAGQVVHVDLPVGVSPEALVRGLGSRLPDDLRLVSAVVAVDDFHARYDAVAKRYVYRLARCRSSRPWADLRHAVVRGPVDPDRLGEVLSRFVGRRDVASFSVTDPGVESTVRTVLEASCRATRRGAVLTFVGDGFLRYQVRRMVGAALDVAHGVRDPAWLIRLLDDPTPGARIRTAPAGGLTLDRVWYRRPRSLESLW